MRTDGDAEPTRSPTPRCHRAALLMVAVALSALAAGCSSSSPSGANANGPTITTANLTFSPTTLRVAPGATVTVVNNDSVVHNVTATGGQFRSGNVSPGRSATFTAPMHAGRYPFTCTIHLFMRGTLVVT